MAAAPQLRFSAAAQVLRSLPILATGPVMRIRRPSLLLSLTGLLSASCSSPPPRGLTEAERADVDRFDRRLAEEYGSSTMPKAFPSSSSVPGATLARYQKVWVGMDLPMVRFIMEGSPGELLGESRGGELVYRWREVSNPKGEGAAAGPDGVMTVRFRSGRVVSKTQSNLD